MRTNLIKNIQKTGLLLVLITGILSSCSDEPKKQVDISEVDAEVKLRRFDHAFFSMDAQHPEKDLSALQDSFPEFYPFYTEDIMQWDEENIPLYCKLLLNDTNVAKLRDTIQLVFGDFQEQMDILTPAFKRFIAFFPEASVPEIITAYTEFAFPSATDSAMLVLPLEMYLGENYMVYQNPALNIPAYILRRMNKHYLPTRAMNAWLDQTFGALPSGNRFVDQMIKEGKQLYYLQSVLPNQADSLISNWNGEQLNWLKENEYQMWTFYINDKYLYSTDPAYYMPLLTDGPFTSAPNIPPGSAPRIGAYTGWQIVQRFMTEHPEKSMLDLFMEMDADKILRESGYRP